MNNSIRGIYLTVTSQLLGFAQAHLSNLEKYDPELFPESTRAAVTRATGYFCCASGILRALDADPGLIEATESANFACSHYLAEGDDGYNRLLVGLRGLVRVAEAVVEYLTEKKGG